LAVMTPVLVEAVKSTNIATAKMPKLQFKLITESLRRGAFLLTLINRI